MRLTSPDSIIECDGRKIIKGFKLNLIPHDRQLRLKTTLYDRGEKEIPIDLVIFNYSKPILSLPSIGFTVTGVENNTNCNFSLKLSINIVKRNLSVIGRIKENSIEINAKPINISLIAKVIDEILTIVKNN